MKETATDIPGESSPRQHLRIHTFGRFQIEWADPQTGQMTPLPAGRLRGQNAGSALGLFKALLSCPDRFATRSWLNEQFWPDSTVKRAEERLNDVVSSLRTLLRPTGSSEMLVHFVYGTSGRGAGYRLDTYPQLWCDADAFEWYVRHALLLDQRGQDSTACWEHASALAERGTYLPEQIEDDWSRPRRDYLHSLLRDCVHRWTTILRQTGHVNEAILRLRSYWLEHPTDEDTLRPLIEMLGECERFGEAEECYVKAVAMLTEENHAPDYRTTDTIEAMRALKIQRKQVIITNTRASNRFAVLPSSVAYGQETSASFQQNLLFSQRDTQNSVSEGNIEQNEDMRISFWTEEQNSVPNENINNERRNLIKGMGASIGATSLAFFFPDFSSLANISEQLKQYQEQVPLHWNGFFTTPGQSSITTIEAIILELQHLSSYANVLQQGILQNLLCQYHQLAADQLRDRGRINEALKHSDLAVYLAEHLQHVELLAAALYRRGLTYFDAGQIDIASRNLIDALPFARISRPQLKGMIYMEAGRFQAHLARSEHDKAEATRLLDQTEHIVHQEHLEVDAGYVKLNQGRYHIGRAATLLALNHPQEAFKELLLAEQLTPAEYQRRHAYINILRARLHFMQRQYDQAAHLALQAFPICQMVHSESNVSDIYRLYKELVQSSFAQASVVHDLGCQIRRHQKGALL